MHSRSLNQNMSFPSTEPAYLLKKDITGRVHLRQTSSTAGRSSKFKKIRHDYLSGKLEFKTPIQNVAFCLVCFDGIVTRHDLSLALGRVDSCYKVDGEACIDWKYENKQVNRRYLCPITVFGISRLEHPTEDARDILRRMDSGLSAYYPLATSPLDNFFIDAQCWATQVLPGPLWAHCVSASRLSALSRETLARASSKLALHVSSNPEDSKSDIALGIALEGYLSGNVKGGSSRIIRKIITICQYDANKAHYLEKRRMLKACRALAPEARESGRLPSLILAWAIELIESGTPWHEKYSPNSIQKYISNSAIQLFSYFQGKELEELPAEEFTDLYTVIIAAAPSSQQQTTRAALNAWHWFIHTWLDVPPLTKSLVLDAEPAIPRANILWRHEIDILLKWLSDSQMDERLCQQLILTIHISANLRVRIGELLKLRMKNFQVTPTGIWVQVNPLRRDGKPKSPSARRHMLISNEKAVTVIANWLSRRESESALSTDLIFADPHSPSQGYRRGYMYVCLNRLLKCITGDKSAASHIFSHTWISNRVEWAMLHQPETDINELDLISTEAGHAATQTTLIHYSHLYEKPLRYFLDQAFLSEEFLTGNIVERFSNMGAAAFRQRCHRKNDGTSNQEIAWKVLSDAMSMVELPLAHSAIDMTAPCSPDFLYATPEVSLTDVINILSDLAVGHLPDSVSSRSGMSLLQVYKIANHAHQILTELNLIEKTTSTKSDTEALIELQEIFTTNNHHIDFKRISQPKLAPLFAHLSKVHLTDALLAAITSWKHCFKNGYLSLVKPANGASLIKLLKDADMPSDLLFLCVPASPSGSCLTKSIKSIFLGAGYHSPILVELQPRRGRPSHYLSISSLSGHPGEKVRNAALSMDGFNALMLAASIYAHIRSIRAAHDYRNKNEQ